MKNKLKHFTFDIKLRYKKRVYKNLITLSTFCFLSIFHDIHRHRASIHNVSTFLKKKNIRQVSSKSFKQRQWDDHTEVDPAPSFISRRKKGKRRNNGGPVCKEGSETKGEQGRKRKRESQRQKEREWVFLGTVVS